MINRENVGKGSRLDSLVRSQGQVALDFGGVWMGPMIRGAEAGWIVLIELIRSFGFERFDSNMSDLPLNFGSVSFDVSFTKNREL